MSNFSKGEIGAMKAAFMSMFNVDNTIANTDAVIKWMTDAPAGIVEYEGRFTGEGKHERDHRMEMYEVYDGIISDLVSYLRKLFKSSKGLSKWELIFKTYNEIMDVQKVIEQAELQIINGTDVSSETTPQVGEEQLNSQGYSTEEKSVADPVEELTAVTVEPMVETNPPEIKAEPVSESSAVNVKEDFMEVSLDREENSKEGVNADKTQDESPKEPVVMPSGNVQQTDEQPLLNKKPEGENYNFQEEKKMNEMDKLLNAANAGAPADPSMEQQVPDKANVAAASVDTKEAQTKVADLLNNTTADRSAWTRNNFVTAIISPQKPAALRVKSREGLATSEKDAAKISEDIDKKIKKFINGVAGKDDLTIEQFEAMTDAEKFANVVPKEKAVDKARAIYELYKKIKNNPTATYPAFIPGNDKLNYPIKGYKLGSTPLPIDEFILEAIENSTGVVYGEGSCDAEGHSVGEKPVTFQIGVAKRTESAKSKGITDRSKEIKVPVVRPKNKKEFIDGGNRVEFLFTQEDTENEGKASFKAAIMVGGELMPATVSVYALESGKRVQRGVDSDNNPVYKTKTVSCSVSVPVTKIIRKFAAQYQGDEAVIVTAGRWGVNMSVQQQKGDFGQITDISQAPVFNVFADVYAGNVTLTKALKGSKVLTMLKAEADKQAEADAEASADELM